VLKEKTQGSLVKLSFLRSSFDKTFPKSFVKAFAKQKGFLLNRKSVFIASQR
jgi:hypothetical protein